MIRPQVILQRKLIQWAIAYLAGAWLLLQVMDLLADAFGWPEIVQRIAIVVLAIGFLAVLVLAWYHGEQGRQQATGVELLMLAGILVLAGVGVAWITGERATAAPPPPIAATGTATEQGSIAVLPFVNMSSDAEQGYFSDGLTEELLNVLAQIPELRVAARTSAFSFKDTNVPVDSIGRALNVAHVLEGSVRKSGDQVRITAQLIDASSGFHLWSETYDRSLTDVFAVQDEIAQAIVGQLRLKLSSSGPLVRQETTDPEAHALVLRGLVERTGGTRESLAAAAQAFQEAIARDPNYARAHAELAGTRVVQVYFRLIPREQGSADALASAERALALDSTQSRALAALAGIRERRDWDFYAADSLYRRALASNPGEARMRSLYAWLLMRLGRPDDALREAERALQIDPLSPAVYNNVAAMYDVVGRPERAIAMYQASIALSPAPVGSSNLALTYADLGRHDDALRTILTAIALDEEPNQFTLGTLAYVHAVAGRTAEAEAALARLREQPDVSPYILATVQAGLGNTDRAFELLDDAVDGRDELVPDLGWDLVFTSMRGDPRFAALLERMGLPVPVATPAA